MKTFEDELLAELRTVVAERAETEERRHSGFGRVRSTRGRVVIGLAACVTLAAGAAVGVPLIGGEQTTSSAYSVTTNSAGDVVVEVYRPKDAEGLERRLEAAGIDAEVNGLSAGKTCARKPAGQVLPHVLNGQPLPGSGDEVTSLVTQPRFTDGKLSEYGSFVIDPKYYRGATVTVELTEAQLDPPRETSSPKKPPALSGVWLMRVKYLKNGTFGPCVVVDR